MNDMQDDIDDYKFEINDLKADIKKAKEQNEQSQSI